MWSSPRLHFILCLLLSNFDILPLVQIMESNKISYHNYADDTQIYITTSPGDNGPIQTLSTCIDQIHDWMCQNFLQLNKDKIKVIILVAKEEPYKVSAQLQSIMLKTTDDTRNLQSLTQTWIWTATLTQTYYHLKNILRIKRLMSPWFGKTCPCIYLQ